MLTRPQSTDGSHLRVLLIAEGTYPFYWGGVSTWAHMLLCDLPDVDFTLMSMVADPDTRLQFALPPNVVDFRPIPMWGTHDALEMRRDLSLSEIHRLKRQTTETVINRDFVPVFRSFLHQLFGSRCEPQRLGQIIHQMYRFFIAHDFDRTMRSQVVWRCFNAAAREFFPLMAESSGYPDARFDLADLNAGMNWIYHWLFPLAMPLPRVDVAHAAMVGVSTMVGVVAKLEYGAGLLLTEHGVYLRERYLAEAVLTNSLFGKLLSLRFALRMTQLSYALADQISPCCNYNQRWELRNGADPSRLQTIYYGVDADRFAPVQRPQDGPPVVVWVGRIDPLKDLLTLIEAAAIVHRQRRDVRFVFYGSPPPGNEAYYQQCLDMRTELGLDDTVIFAGYTSNTAAAFNAGDVSVLSSVSEGFPYVILESMLCEKPVVATAVGGIPEQVAGCGIAVEPRNPHDLAQGILILLNDAGLRSDLGRKARAKALHEYSTGQAHGAYYDSYLRLAGSQGNGQGNKNDNGNGHKGMLLASTVPAGQVATASQQSTPDAVVSRESGGYDAAAIAQTALDSSAARRRRKEPRTSADITTLAREIAQRDALPIDALEITAVLESLGITDSVAAQRYGVDDVFGLGEAVLAEMRAAGLIGKVKQPDPEPRLTLRQALMDYARGPIAMAPSLLILVIILAYAAVGHLSQTQVIALGLGMTSGMLVMGGFVHAMGRRGSIYLGMEKPDAAWRFLNKVTMTGWACAAVAAILAFLAVARFSPAGSNLASIFAVALAALSTFWLLGAGLSLVQRTEWLAIALTVGLLVGVATDRALQPYTTAHLGLATLVGYLAIMAVLVRSLFVTYGQAGQRGKLRPRPILPSAAYLTQEAAPYFAYGTLYMVFILLPHVVGWMGIVWHDQEHLWAFTSVEVGLTLSMIPFMLVTGVAERALRLFWRLCGLALKATPGTASERFGQAILQQYRQQRTRYLVILGAASLLDYVLLQAAAQSGLLAHWLKMDNLGSLMVIFETSLIAYWLLGWGMFNSVYTITLARPRLAVRAVGLGIIALLVAGVPLSLGLGFSYAPIAFIAGGAVFAIASSWMSSHVLQSADYYLYAAL